MSADDEQKMKWLVYVYEKTDSQNLIDQIVVMAYRKDRAERIGLLFTSDHYNLKTKELTSQAEEFDKSKHKAVTQDTHEYLAAAQMENIESD